jgi:hypothetical protein
MIDAVIPVEAGIQSGNARRKWIPAPDLVEGILSRE